MNFEWEVRQSHCQLMEEAVPYRKEQKENIVLEKSFLFAVRIVRLRQYLVEQKNEFVLSKQVLRSGTFVGANAEEAMAASSTRDFIAKLDIAAEEVRETSYFLRLLHQTDYLPDTAFDSIHHDCLELKKIITSILLTTKQNSHRVMNS